MATLKQRLHRKNSSGTYDTIHLETSADLIIGTGCSTEDELKELILKYAPSGGGGGATVLPSLDDQFAYGTKIWTCVHIDNQEKRCFACTTSLLVSSICTICHSMSVYHNVTILPRDMFPFIREPEDSPTN